MDGALVKGQKQKKTKTPKTSKNIDFFLKIDLHLLVHTFKLFLPKNDFAFLHIILQRARNIKKMKTDELGINIPIS